VREVRSADAAVAHSLQGTVYSDLTFLRWAVQLGNHGFVATMEHRRLSRSFSVKVTRIYKLLMLCIPIFINTSAIILVKLEARGASAADIDAAAEPEVSYL
jgi:hypothetical protein